MQSIGFYCDANSIEQNAMDQLQQYAEKPFVDAICAFTDIHYCAEKALPVGVASELLNRSGNFPQGYIQEFDFAYKDATEIFKYQPHLKKVTQTTPVVTLKYTEI